MSQVGVAACPKCGARYGVQENAAGQTLPCPACGTRFVVQPVARAADDFLPPSVDLAAGGPIAPVSRVLEPVVYPHRDIPWALIAIGTGLCLVLGLILFGGWKAYQVIDAAVASASTEQGELTGSAATEAATGTATDVADQVAADATAAVEGASKAINRIAGAVTDSIEVPKLLPDSHERMADERDRLQADYRRIREAFDEGKPKETVDKLTDLQLRTGDLAIRWSFLAPMTENERERLKPRLFESMKQGIGGQPIEEPDSAFRREPWVAAAATNLNNTWKGVTLAIALAVDPPRPEGTAEEKCAELAAGSREVCKELFAVRTVADLERVTPRVQAEIARINSTGALGGAGFNPENPAAMQRMSNLLSQLVMVTFVGSHVTLRFGRDRIDPSAAEADKAAAEEEVKDFGVRIAILMAEYQQAQIAFAARAMFGVPEGTPSVATSVTTESGPTINLPGFGGPFGMPPGFGPAGFGPAGFGPSGFGPSPGSGGVLDGSNPHPSPAAFSGANLDAEFEAKRQQFAQQHGADGILTVRASGGTEGQFKALEATVMRLVRPRGHSMNRVGERYQLSVVFAGDVERIAAAITTGKVTTDVTGRLIVVDFKPAR